MSDALAAVRKRLHKLCGSAPWSVVAYDSAGVPRIVHTDLETFMCELGRAIETGDTDAELPRDPREGEPVTETHRCIVLCPPP